MVAPGLLEHVGDELGRDRRAALVLLVLARVREEGHDGGDALRARDLARVDHDAQLHERRVDLAAAGVDDVHVVLAHGLADAHVRLADPAASDFGLGELNAEPAARGQGQRRKQGQHRRKRVGGENKSREAKETYRRAMSSASSGWLLPAKSGSSATQRGERHGRRAPVKTLMPLPFNMVVERRKGQGHGLEGELGGGGGPSYYDGRGR